MPTNHASLHSSLLTKTGRIFTTSLERKLREAGALERVKLAKPNSPLVEAYYWFHHGLTEYPKKCKVCSAPLTRFGGFNVGYLFSTCSKTCAALDKDRQERIQSTVMERYGVEHQMKSADVVEKVKATCMSRYGVTGGLATESSRAALAKKFGVAHISKTAQWRNKTTATFNERYGGRGFAGDLGAKGKSTLADELGITDYERYSYQQLAAWAASKRGLMATAAEKQFELQSFNGPNKELVLKHACGELKTISLDASNRLRCYGCQPHSISQFETEVAEFLTTLGVSFTRNDRKLIKPLELDIVIPDRKLAIECNGDYWHSFTKTETKEERRKHLTKLQAAQAAGYQLIQIAEHEWHGKPEQIRSILRVKLGMAKVVHGRKITIRKITSREANEFCNKNHIQGKAAHNLALGGFMDDRMVAVVTAGNNRFTKDGSLELIRFCTALNTVVTGGFSKLIKALKAELGDVPIDSYLDRRLFDGHSLLATGWQLVRTSDPGYCWLYQGQKVTRQRAQKHRLGKLIGEAFDPSLSEADNMFAAGGARLWDCGQHLFRLG